MKKKQIIVTIVSLTIILAGIGSAVLIRLLTMEETIDQEFTTEASVDSVGGLGQAHWVGGQFNTNDGIKFGYSSSSAYDMSGGDHWGVIEKTKGTYNWSQVDDMVANAKSRNKKLWLQIQTSDSTAGEVNVPQWAIDAGVDMYTPICGTEKIKDTNSPHYNEPVEIPAVWDQKYRNELKKALQQMNTKYGSDSSIEAIIIMIGGSYGELDIKPKCGPGMGCDPIDVVNPDCDVIKSMARVTGRPASEITSKSKCDWQSGNPTVAATGDSSVEDDSTCYVFDDYYIKAATEMIDMYAEVFPNKPLILQDGAGLSWMKRVSTNVKNYAVDNYGSRIWFKSNGWGPVIPVNNFERDYGSRTRHGYEPGDSWFFSKSYWGGNGGVAAGKTTIADWIKKAIVDDKSSFLTLQGEFFDPVLSGQKGNEYYFNPTDMDSTCANSEISVAEFGVGWCPGFLNTQMGVPTVVDPPDTLGRVATPTFSPPGGERQGQFTLSIACSTVGADIYYTTNGDEPTKSSTKYTAPFEANIFSDTTYKAKAFKSGLTDSGVGSVTYTVPVTGEKVAKPIISIVSNDDGTVSISIMTATQGAKIYYTLDGSVPRETSTEYTTLFDYDTPGSYTIKARAFKTDMSESEIASKSFTVTNSEAGTTVLSPSLSPAGGTYTSSQNVTISTGTSGASIYYTTDGTEPDNSDTKYTSVVPISSTKTIKAIAYKDGVYSTVKTATYIIDATPPAEDYTVSVDMNSFVNSASTVAVSIKNSSGQIVYSGNKTIGSNGNLLTLDVDSSKLSDGNYSIRLAPMYHTYQEIDFTVGSSHLINVEATEEFLPGAYTESGNGKKVTVSDIAAVISYFINKDHSKDLDGDGKLTVREISLVIRSFRLSRG